MDFLLLLSNGEMGEMGNILYDVEIDDQLGRTWQSWILSQYSPLTYNAFPSIKTQFDSH